jgi:DNA repair protein RecO (recombination protein O)
MSRAARRVQLAEGYVLHHRPYRDTSRIVEVFTREHGRLTLFARGVRGPKSRLAPVLQPFRRLLLSFFLGRGDAAQLTGAELADAAAPTPRAETLMSAYYLSELLLKLTERLDAQPALYEAYSRALQRLCEPGPEAPVLREFELQLLQACGYGIDFAGLDPTQRYLFTQPVTGTTPKAWRLQAGSCGPRWISVSMATKSARGPLPGRCAGRCCGDFRDWR